MKCPICKGKGEIKDPPTYRYDYVEAKRKMARVLRGAGFTYRQIAKFCGWKSPRSALKAQSI